MKRAEGFRLENDLLYFFQKSTTTPSPQSIRQAKEHEIIRKYFVWKGVVGRYERNAVGEMNSACTL